MEIALCLGENDAMPQSAGKQRALRRTGARIVRTVGATVLGVPLLWIGYSATLINHRVPLPPAINAPRHTFTSATAGELSYYSDTTASGRPPYALLIAPRAAAIPAALCPPSTTTGTPSTP